MITTQDIINEDIRALSWRQPYADMMLQGKIETRLWPTAYRGLVLICASKNQYSDDDIDRITGDGALFKIVRFSKRTERRCQLLNGVAIAIGRLVDCRPMEPEDELMTLVQYEKPWVETLCRGKHKQYKLVERKIYCHIYENVIPIEPFPWKGTQGWKKLNDIHKLLINPIIEI